MANPGSVTVSRYAICNGPRKTSTPYSFRMRSFIISKCNSPIPENAIRLSFQYKIRDIKRVCISANYVRKSITLSNCFQPAQNEDNLPSSTVCPVSSLYLTLSDGSSRSKFFRAISSCFCCDRLGGSTEQKNTGSGGATPANTA